MNLGATHAFASIDDATDFARSVTFGQGADAAIITVGILDQELVFFQKRLQGALFGASNPTRDVPWLLDMYRSGRLRSTK